MQRLWILGTLALALAAGGAYAADEPAATTKTVKAAAAPAGAQVAVLETTVGKIVIKLKDADAPKTVANFKKLVKDKFYDGTCFHRVIPGFMIQGGDPNSKNADPSDDGVGGPGYTVPAEIKLPHLRGSVATARQGDQVNPTRASSGSQFFIDVAPQASLDRGGYTVFGEVLVGMDAVDKIVAMGNDTSLPQAGGGGRNPGKKAQILHATLEPLAKYEKTASAPADEKPAPAAAEAAKSDSTK
jgi:cyclophilin family peptidyl-prolyl cis-trans isomerase